MTTSSKESSRALTRVREAEDALDKARGAMDTIQNGLSAVEKAAKKADRTRRHPMRTGAVVFIVLSILLGAVIGIKNAAE